MRTRIVDDLRLAFAEMRRELDLLKAEAAVRNLLGRYMFLCDMPSPAVNMSTQERVAEIGHLFTADGVWEGVGSTHGARFGRHVGPTEIAAHMEKFYAAVPQQVFNTHYVCTEQVRATTPDSAEGQWVQFQPWINEHRESLLRSSRLHVKFRLTDRGWKIAHYRTENLFIADLPPGWTTSLISESVLMRVAAD